MNGEFLLLLFASIAALVSVVAAYLAIVERNLVRAVVFSAIQSTMYAFILYVLMAPDILLVYLPVSVGILPAVFLILIQKTEKEEKL